MQLLILNYNLFLSNHLNYNAGIFLLYFCLQACVHLIQRTNRLLNLESIRCSQAARVGSSFAYWCLWVRRVEMSHFLVLRAPCHFPKYVQDSVHDQNKIEIYPARRFFTRQYRLVNSTPANFVHITIITILQMSYIRFISLEPAFIHLGRLLISQNCTYAESGDVSHVLE